jgi:hypothetical protein
MSTTTPFGNSMSKTITELFDTHGPDATIVKLGWLVFIYMMTALIISIIQGSIASTVQGNRDVGSQITHVIDHILGNPAFEKVLEVVLAKVARPPLKPLHRALLIYYQVA